MFGVWPGAAGTVKTLGLIGLEQRLGALRDDLLVGERFRDRFYASQPPAG